MARLHRCLSKFPSNLGYLDQIWKSLMIFCIHFRENGNSKAILTRKPPKLKEVHKCTQMAYIFFYSFFSNTSNIPTISYILTGRKSGVPSMCFCEKDRPIGCMLHNIINVSLNLLLFVRCKSWNKRSDSDSHLANDCISD